MPSVSAAEALAGTPFFGELSTVDLARLVPDLEEYHFAPGQAVFCRGDPGDGLYLIRSGTAEVTVEEADGTHTVSTLDAPAHFGETALLTHEPRSASVVAATPLTLWKLPRDRFTGLVEERPHLALGLAGALAARLAEVTHRLSASQERVTTVARAAYGSLDLAAQALLRRCAVFRRFDIPLLQSVLAPEWSDAAFERVVREGIFFRASESPGWQEIVQPAVRDFLLNQLRAEIGARGLSTLRRRAAEALLARPDADPLDALDLLHAAGDWPRLARLLEDQSAALAARDSVRVEGHLRALPDRLLWRRPPLVHLLAECCAAQGRLEQAIAAYQEAERRDRAARRPPLLVEYQRALAALHDQIGDQEASRACLARAGQFSGASVAGGGVDGSRTDGAAYPAGADPCGGSAPIQPLPPGVLPAVWLGSVVGRLRGRTFSPRLLMTVGVLALVTLAWLLPPPPGLSTPGLRVLVTVIALAALSFLDVLPEYLLALLMITAWIVTGTLPPPVAASGFASSTWFLLLASMAIGAAVARSGLLYRGAIELVRRLPPSYPIRCLTLGVLGILFTPGMPSVAGRVMLAAPLAQDISDALRYPARSGGSAGLGLATFVGFGMMGSLFLTGSPLCLIAYGLLPPEVQAEMTWVKWFLAALPAHLILFGLTLAFLLVRYRPDGSDHVPAGTLALQLRVLGRLSRDEWSALTVLILLLIGFSTQSIHHVDPAWLAVGAVVILFLAGALDDTTFRQGVNLSFLLYLGVILSFGQVFSHVELDRWLSQHLQVLAGPAGGSAFRLLIAVAALAAIIGLVLRPGPIALVIGAALYPMAATAGVHPWVVALTVLLASNLWLYPQQNLLYQAAYYTTGERAFTHPQARPLAFAFAAFVLISVLVSIPFWRWIGLIG